MAIERKTVVDQIEITREGVVRVRLGLLLVEDGAELACSWHRLAIDENTDIDATFDAVNEDLVLGKGCKPVEVADIARVKDYAAFTADLKAAALQVKGE